MGEGCWGENIPLHPSASPGAGASSQSARFSAPHANVKVCRYYGLTSPQKVPNKVLIQWDPPGKCLLAPTCRAQTPLASLLTGTGGAGCAPGKTFEKGPQFKVRPQPQARGSLELILAEPPVQVVANDSLSQPNAIFTMRYPEITGSLERANCHFSCRGRLAHPPSCCFNPVALARSFLSHLGIFFLNSFSFNSFLSLMGDWINSVVDFCDTKAADKSMMHSSYVV